MENYIMKEKTEDNAKTHFPISRVQSVLNWILFTNSLQKFMRKMQLCRSRRKMRSRYVMKKTQNSLDVYGDFRL